MRTLLLAWAIVATVNAPPWDDDFATREECERMLAMYQRDYGTVGVCVAVAVEARLRRSVG
jgi:hypothetical protein